MQDVSFAFSNPPGLQMLLPCLPTHHKSNHKWEGFCYAHSWSETDQVLKARRKALVNRVLRRGQLIVGPPASTRHGRSDGALFSATGMLQGVLLLADLASYVSYFPFFYVQNPFCLYLVRDALSKTFSLFL